MKVVIMCLMLLLCSPAVGQLSSSFYEETCPSVAWLVGGAVAQAVRKEPRVAASLLRLHYHDCFVNGCDASILLDDTPSSKGEKNAAANRNSARGFEVIDDAKEQVERECPGVVSCADILALAAREAVAMVGGPMWTVYYGRRDSTFASFRAANTEIPGPNLSLNQLLSAFNAKGLSPKETVALLGAHTIGQARCVSFKDRLYNFRGTGRADGSLARGYQASLRQECPLRGGDNVNIALDVQTPDEFDNSYFRNLQANMGLLNTDQVLYSSGAGFTQVLVDAYSNDGVAFSRDFAAAMVKMGSISPLTGSRGQIRRDCRAINW